MSAPVVLQPRLLQVRTQYTPNPDTGDHPENILWFQSASAGTPTIANLTAMAAVFDPAWGAMGPDFLASGRKYTGSVWTDYSTSTGLSYSSVGTYAGSSTMSGLALPANVAILISLHIQQRYRGGHPRIYLPWVSVSAQSTTDTNQVAAATISALGTAFANINVATTGSGVLGGQTQMVYRHKTNPTSAALFQISAFTVQQTLASQRRRLRKAPHH